MMNRSPEGVVSFTNPDRSDKQYHDSNIMLEEQVVGALMTDPTLWKECSDLTSEHFTDPSLSWLWAEMTDRLIHGKPASATVLALALENRLDEIGGRAYLTRLCAAGQGIGLAIRHAAEQLRHLDGWRKISQISLRLTEARRSRGKTPDQVLSETYKDIEAAFGRGAATARSKADVARSAVTRAQTAEDPTPTGIDDIDTIAIGGLIPTRTIGFGAEYGLGKTIMAGTISANLHFSGIPHLFIALETPPEDIEIRSCARSININANHIYDRYHPAHDAFVTNAEKYVDLVSRSKDGAFYEFAPGATIDDIIRRILRAVHRHGIRGFFLDHIQLVKGRPTGISEENHLGDVADRLAALCRNHNLWAWINMTTDAYGKPRIAPERLLGAVSLGIVMERDENGDAARLRVTKTNYTRYTDTGSQTTPNLIFDVAGPHFRNTAPSDIAGMK